MIYSTNRTASLGDMSVGVNESYFGIGAMSFMEEAAQDELAIFESAIKSDIDEVLIGESSYELAALNENFVDSAVNKIKELMKKFVAWIESVVRSAFAKLSQLLVRDNAKFAAVARKQIIKMKNKDKFKYSGKYLIELDEYSFDKGESVDDIKKLFDDIKDKASAESAKAKMETIKKGFDELEVSKAMEAITKETTDGDLKLVERHLTMLETLSKKHIKEVKKELDNAKKGANELSKKADKMAREAKDEDKEVANMKAEIASTYKSCVQKFVVFELAMIKAQAKIARSVVAKAMGATPKNEGFEYDEELTDAMIEAAEYEYDSAMEEMSEGSKCEECDDSDDEFDDDDMD